MKTLTLILFACWPAIWMSAQEKSMPGVDLRDIDGKIISSAEILQPGTPTMVVFWKSTDGRYFENLDNMAQAWEETLKLKGLRMVAICIDCNGSWSQVKPIVNGNGWEFDTYIDVNGDFKRAMCVGDGPCTMVYDGDENLVCRYYSNPETSQEIICTSILDNLDLSATASNFEVVK
jgi:hypothetical protein